jgi:hypothetical protein
MVALFSHFSCATCPAALNTMRPFTIAPKSGALSWVLMVTKYHPEEE